MISAVLLAAGISKRFGKEDKLLSKYKKKSLLIYALENLKKSKVSEIIIVTGKNHKELSYKIKKNSRIRLIYNKNYSKGMSSSLLAGMRKINKNSKGFLICLADMPKIKSATYNKIIQFFKKNPNLPLIPFFKSQSGNPVCFPMSFKAKLRSLKGDRGAKKILQKNKFNKINIKSKSILIDFDKKSDFRS